MKIPTGRLKGRLYVCAMLLAFLVCLPGSALGADVDVYAEGGYTSTNLVLDIYAHINVDAILSFGVKVNFPSGLTVLTATKNESVWYFGEGGAEYDYMDPEINTDSVVIIGGKLDTLAPIEGVSGKVFLGRITFSHSDMTDFSGIEVTYGRGDGTGEYENFVMTDGTPLDGVGVSFSVNIVCDLPGDANRDGTVNITDLGYVQSNWMRSGPDIVEPRADINKDGTVNITDLGFVQSNWQSTCP